MTSKGGEIDNRVHTFDEWCKFVIAEHPVIFEQLLNRRPIIFDYDVPYLGGISRDGRFVYIDRHYKSLLQLRAGTLDSAYTMHDHELAEWVCVTILGMKYPAAHIWGNTAEWLAVKTRGAGWLEYNAAIDKIIPKTEVEQITLPPWDLALYPYKDNPKLFKHLMKFQRP